MASASFQERDKSWNNHVKDVSFSQVSEKRPHLSDSHVDISNDNSLNIIKSHPSEHTISRIEHKVHLPEVATGGASRLFDSVLSAAREAAVSWGFKNDTGQTQRKHNKEIQEDFDEKKINEEEDTEVSNVKLKNLSDVVIHRIRPTISTLGEGELSLATLDQRTQAKTPLPDTVNYHSDSLVTNDDDLSSTWGRGVSTSNGSSRSHSEAPGATQTPRSRQFSALHESSFPNEMKVNDAISNSRMKRDASSPAVSRQTSAKRTLTGDISNDQIASSEDNSAQMNGERRTSVRKNKLSRAKHVTGFAFADRKRNKDFHRLFRTVPYSDYLLDDFSCALSREILLQGRLYVSEYRLCFYSNIIGWVTHLVIGFDEIVSLEKKNTAGLFPNGIVVQTLHARYSLASFVSRDSTFEFIKSVWKKSNVQNGSRSESQDASSIEENENESDFESDGSYMNDSMSNNSMRNDEDEEFTLGDVDSQASDVSLSVSGSDSGSSDSNLVTVEKEVMKETEDKAQSRWPAPNLGPETHEPTTVPPPENTNEKVFMTGTVKAPVGVVANLLWGEDTQWMFRFLTEREKNTELAELPKFKDQVRKYEYIKPLHASMGPKSTKCICTETIEKWNMEDVVSAILVTQTPNVPSGSSFVTKSRTILSWGDQNTTKLTASFWIEWSAKSWIKGPIEKGAEDGQVQSMNDLIEEINNTISSSSGKKSRKKGKVAVKKQKMKEETIKKRQKKKPMEGHSVKAALMEFVSSLLSMNNTTFFILIFFVGAIMGRFFFSPSVNRPTLDDKQLQLLRLRQEYELWKWIDDRSSNDPLENSNRNANNDAIFLHGQQQLNEIIKVTEHRLEQLKKKLGQE